jgi:hypothetical protein
MSWSFNVRGKTETSGVPLDMKKNVGDVALATETIALGAGKGNRYSSVIDWIPFGVPFTVISNTGATNLSGSASDQLYAAYERGGTYFQVLAHLRDANYKDALAGGVAVGSVDNAARLRYVDPSYIGSYPYWKIRILQAAVESSAKKVGLAVIVGAPKDQLLSWKKDLT